MAKNSIASAYVHIIPTTEGIGGNLEKELGGASEKAGRNSGGKFGAAFKKVIAAVGITEVLKATISAGADIQQSFGGLDTIYGDTANAAKQYAAEAAKIGLSANEYAEQAVSFGASLKQAFGGDTIKAAEAANTAIMDMTDNAAKMGTPIENIQNAYQGFAKQNYTMLDNLKLGYGGTKQEMERLLADAEKLTGQKYDISNLGDVYDAIHAIQGELGLTGVAAEEAKTTFTGSLGAMKASATNVLAALATGEDVTNALKGLGDSLVTFITGNLFPMVTNIIGALPNTLVTMLTSLAPTLIPAGLSMINGLLTGITQALPDIINGVVELIPMMTTELINGLPMLIDGACQLFVGIIEAIPIILPQLIAALPDIINTITKALIKSAPTILKATVTALGSIVKAIPKVVGSVFSAMQAVGRNLVQGLWNGISNVTGWVLDKIRGFGRSILNGIKNIFGIHSPSKEMAWMGKMLDEGLAQGITKNTDIIDAAIGDMTTATFDGFSPVINSEPSIIGSTDNAGILGAIGNIADRLNNLGIYLDGDTLVGGIQSRMDNALGQNARTNSRLSLA